MMYYIVIANKKRFRMVTIKDIAQEAGVAL